MRPFFCNKIRVVGNHAHESGLCILRWIENIVEFQQGRGRSWLDNRGRDNEKVEQSKEDDHVCKIVVIEKKNSDDF